MRDLYFKEWLSLNNFMVTHASLLKCSLIWTSWRYWDQLRGLNLNNKPKSQDSSGGIATGSTAGVRNLFPLHSVQTGSGVQTASYKMGTGGFSPGVKLPGREADH
jgi:hypothetical protein